jgi:hypothetical protein
MMKNLLKDSIFNNFFYSVELSTPLLDAYDACIGVKNSMPGVQNSNRIGWQSVGFGCGAPNLVLENLTKEVIEFADHIALVEMLGFNFKIANWWINVNPTNSYNVVHSHPGTDLVVLYYPTVPENSGRLAIVRNDSSLSSNLFINRPEELNFAIQPISGRAYAFPAWFLHYVEPSSSRQERVSIAFNLCAVNPN